MTYGNPDPTALYILRDILQGPVTAGQLTGRYALSRDMLHRYLDDLRHIGVLLEITNPGDEEQLRCLNVESVRASAILRSWMTAESQQRVESAREAIGK